MIHRFLSYRWLFRALCASAALAWLSPAASAVRPSDTLLPRTTTGYVSVVRPAELKADWQQTQLGMLLNDYSMKAFVDSLKEQMETKFGVLEEKLGFQWTHLQGVPAGELSLSMIPRADRDAALAITIDVTGHAQQARRLLGTVEDYFINAGGQKKTIDRNGTSLTVFELPADQPGDAPQQTVYFIKENLLCGVDDPTEADAMLKRFVDRPQDSLQSQPVYTTTMDRCRREAGRLEPGLRWFVEPFGFVRGGRTWRKSTEPRRDRDMVAILEQQGFDAIQGVGGFVKLLPGDHAEILHHTAIFAPPTPGKEDDPLRWNLAMRIMQLPNAEALVPQSWVPRMSATYQTFQVDIQNAFDNVDTLFDAVTGHPDSFQTTMEGMEKDRYGPRVNIRDEFVAPMGSRITIVTDYSTPITVESERSVVAIEAADEKRLAATVAKIWAKEPDVERREFGELVIWERLPPGAIVEELKIDAPGFTPLTLDETEDDTDEEDRERVLPSSAVCVTLGHLFMASDIDFLKELLAGFGQRDMLATSGDYRQIVALMEQVAPGPRSGWTFSRTDEALRPTYELIRQGRMPESKTMLGKMLNELLTTEVEREEGIIRKQRIDGATLPNFEMVRRYFGPSGTVLRSDPDGWFLSGVVLNKEAP